MARKKFDPKKEIDKTLLQFREKRKWQIALRRYVLEQNKSSYYAPFFALGIEKFREWIEQQFDQDLSWQNFSKAWQFDHIVPVAYFDFSNEEEMRLCWNFINIRVEKINQNKTIRDHIDVLAAKRHFEQLFQHTGYFMCKKLIEKIEQVEILQLGSNEKLEMFINKNKAYLNALTEFTAHEYEKLNTGTPLENILFELNFLKRFGKQ